MANMVQTSEWTFTVSNKEMLLILKALGGRLKDDEEDEQAMALGDKLTTLRIKELENVTKQLRDALAKEDS